MSHFKLRDYQIDCVKVAKERLSTHDDCLIVAGMGSGKSVVMSKLISELKGSVLVIVNQNKLVTQGLKNLELFNGDIGIYNAGMGRKELDKRVVIASIQSIWRKSCYFDYIVIDEVHRFDFRYGMFGEFISGMHGFKCIGFTATPFTNSEYIYGDDKFFKEVAFEKSLRELTNEGYLVPMKFGTGKKESLIDVSNVKVTAGDYNQKQLEKEVGKPTKLKIQVEDALKKKVGKSIWMCVTIAHAEMVQRLVPDSILVHSQTNQSLEPFINGAVDDVISVMMLGEGVDIPCAQTLVLMRPTKSLRLYVQAAGRVLRTFKDKHHALLLDYGHVVENLGSIYEASLDEKKDLKICIECETYNKPSAKKCYVCDSLFYKQCPKCLEMIEVGSTCDNCFISSAKSVVDPLKNLSTTSYSSVERVEITAVMCYMVKSKSGHDMLKVDYMETIFKKAISEYHDQRNSGRSYYYRQWLQDHTYVEDYVDINDITSKLIKVPKWIEMQKGQKFKQITDRGY